MEGVREGDVRVPLISSLFCIFVLTGGVFLVLYVFVPDASQPWFPVVALILIGSPWIFWLLTYMYACVKHCCRRSSLDERQISRRGSQGMTRTGTSTNNRSVSQNNAAKDGGSQVTSPNAGGKHVHFGQVVVMESEDNSGSRKCGHDESISSSKEIEMPLNTAPLS